MVAESLQIILVPTLKCNADCDYCFEVKSPDTMTLDQLTFLIRKLVEYMEETGAGETTIYWQGGEVLGMGPEWYMKAGEIIEDLTRPKRKRLSISCNQIYSAIRGNGTQLSERCFLTG